MINTPDCQTAVTRIHALRDSRRRVFMGHIFSNRLCVDVVVQANRTKKQCATYAHCLRGTGRAMLELIGVYSDTWRLLLE